MGYVCDQANLEWKLRLLDAIEKEINGMEK